MHTPSTQTIKYFGILFGHCIEGFWQEIDVLKRITRLSRGTPCHWYILLPWIIYVFFFSTNHRRWDHCINKTMFNSFDCPSSTYETNASRKNSKAEFCLPLTQISYSSRGWYLACEFICEFFILFCFCNCWKWSLEGRWQRCYDFTVNGFRHVPLLCQHNANMFYSSVLSLLKAK